MESVDAIRVLIHKYVNENISEAEEKELWEYVHSHAANEVLFAQLTDEEERKKLVRQFAENDARWENDFIIPRKARQFTISRKLYRTLAAAVLAGGIITTTLYLLFPVFSTPKDSVATHQQQPDLPHGTRRATLLLADQQTISLDAVQPGVITRQGNISVTKDADGALKYERLGGNVNVGTNVLSTPRAGFYLLTLSEGSRVWLNADSKLTYPVAFTGDERRVKLSGEAFFEISKDAAKPFYVETGNGNVIKVTGTKFNVSSYPDDLLETTSLLEGAVSVTASGTTKLLHPGQQATVAFRDKKLTVAEANVNASIFWTRNYFYFNHASLSEVMRQISRWYDVDVKMSEAVLKKNPGFQGGFSRNMPLSKVLANLSNYDLKIRYQLIDGVLIVDEAPANK